MEIKWYGHASFRITTENGTRIIIDPYEPEFKDGLLTYGRIEEEADIVVTSHGHGDHGYTKDIRGTFELIEKEGAFSLRGTAVRTFPTFHDNARGTARGENLVTVIAADGLTVAHLGDLGHALDEEARRKMGPVDILLVPVGGLYTIDAATAAQVMKDIGPAITIPMHYRTAKCQFPITGVEEFTRGKKNVRLSEQSALTITKETLPREPEIVVLRHAL
jgi:L-ascorbate metabolism protein UlaG (beta-lactamase superfamily)